MRIIAGQFRGRRLLAPERDTTRPITDRAKQSLFDILTPHIAGSLVYDIFAGTGSMGLECLSRDAKRAVFFERDRSAFSLLQRNIAALGLEANCQVISGDLFKWFESTEPVALDARAAIVFLDPPYRMLRENASALQALAGQINDHHLSERGIVVFRHDAADTLDLPTFRQTDSRIYGDMLIEFLTRL
jgi:16S rRNA (guanine(966)-N(2))-methyltransferase RsmD